MKITISIPGLPKIKISRPDIPHSAVQYLREQLDSQVNSLLDILTHKAGLVAEKKEKGKLPQEKQEDFRELLLMEYRASLRELEIPETRPKHRPAHSGGFGRRSVLRKDFHRAVDELARSQHPEDLKFKDIANRMFQDALGRSDRHAQRLFMKAFEEAVDGTTTQESIAKALEKAAGRYAESLSKAFDRKDINMRWQAELLKHRK